MSYPNLPDNRLIVDGVDLSEKFKMVLVDGYTLSPPSPKTYTVDIPGGNGTLDLTESLIGDVTYGNRKQTFTFYIINTEDFEKVKTEISRFLHGRAFNYVMTMDPEFTYHGRFTVSKYTHKAYANGIVGTITVNVEADPYKLKDTQIYKVDGVGGTTVYLESGRMRVRPTIEVDGLTKVIYNNKLITLQQGAWTINDLLFTEGINEVYVNTFDVRNLKWGELRDYNKLVTEITDDIIQFNNPLPGEVKVSNWVKNLISYPYYYTTRTHNGVTWTDNGDGTITANGTATEDSVFNVCSRTQSNPFRISNGTYTLSGCPSGGGSQTYALFLQKGTSSTYMGALGSDIGNGTTCEVVLEGEENLQIQAIIQAGVTVENLTFRPMLESGSVAHDYVPYSEGENLITYPYKHTTRTVNGLTQTDNGDGTVTVSGTATATTWFALNEDVILGVGTYTLRGCPRNGGSAKYHVRLRLTSDNTDVTAADYGEGITFSISEENAYSTYIGIANGMTVSNLTFKPALLKGIPQEITACGKNLIPYPHNNVSKTVIGVTFTVNDDGTVLVDGTNTGDYTAQHYPTTDIAMGLKPNTTYTLSGCPKGGTASTYRLRIIINYKLAGNVQYMDYGNGVTFTTPSNYVHSRIMIDIPVGATVSNLLFKPQLELGSVATPYEPYKSNSVYVTNDTEAPVVLKSYSGITNVLNQNGTEMTAGSYKATTWGELKNRKLYEWYKSNGDGTYAIKTWGDLAETKWNDLADETWSDQLYMADITSVIRNAYIKYDWGDL